MVLGVLLRFDRLSWFSSAGILILLVGSVGDWVLLFGSTWVPLGVQVILFGSVGFVEI